MYRPDEMAMILEQVKQEAKKNRLAHTEKKVLTFDTGPIGKIEFDFMGRQFTHISDEFTDFNTFARLIFFADNANMNPIGVTKEDFVAATETMDGVVTSWLIRSGDDSDDFYGISTSDTVLIEDIEIPKGTSLFLGEVASGGYNRGQLELETIHPIPQEYIPPLDRLILNGADGNQYALTITDGAISVAPVTT